MRRWLGSAGFLLLVSSLIIVLGNMILGFRLMNSDSMPSTNHLSLSLILLFFLVTSFICLQSFSKQSLIDGLSANEKTAHRYLETRTRASFCSGLTILTWLISAISGTFSHAGRLPLLHLVFGILQMGVLAYGLFYWYQIIFVFRSTSKS